MSRARPFLLLGPRPLRLTAALAVVLTLGCVAAGAWRVVDSRSALAQANAQLAAAQANTALGARRPPVPDFTANVAQRLSGPQSLDQTLRHVTRSSHASSAAARVQVHSLSIQPQTERGGQLSRHHLTLALSADYPAFKAWLSELLERQPGLAIAAMSLRRVSEAPLDIQLTLVLHTWQAP